MEYLIAIGWGSIGWAARVGHTYFIYSKKVESTPRGKFSFKKWKTKYDQDWIYGFVAMLALTALSDLFWEYALSQLIFGAVTPYESRVNVMIGFMSIYLIEKFANKK